MLVCLGWYLLELDLRLGHILEDILFGLGNGCSECTNRLGCVENLRLGTFFGLGIFLYFRFLGLSYYILNLLGPLILFLWLLLELDLVVVLVIAVA